jgi:hypothetical protein
LIPEGWWHQVDSDEFTIAVNYWWDGVREQLVADKRMVPYYARVMMAELVKQQCESRLLALQSASEDSTRIYQDDNSAAAAISAASDQDARERMLLSLDSKVFQKTQLRLATDLPSEWRNLLASASADLAAVLANCWESDELEPDFLDVLFGALGDEEEVIKEQLVAKQAQFRQDCAASMYGSLFGQLQAPAST